MRSFNDFMAIYWLSCHNFTYPRPNHTLLASSGVQVGLKKSAKLIPAEVLGYVISISAWGMLIGKVSATLPFLPPMLKLLSACYIIFLAIKLWHTANQQFELDQPTIRPRELFCATLLNLKHYFLLQRFSLFPHGLIFIFISSICWLI